MHGKGTPLTSAELGKIQSRTAKFFPSTSDVEPAYFTCAETGETTGIVVQSALRKAWVLKQANAQFELGVDDESAEKSLLRKTVTSLDKALTLMLPIFDEIYDDDDNGDGDL
jgi:hypothetical protein